MVLLYLFIFIIFYLFIYFVAMRSGPRDLQVHTAFVHYNETEVENLFGTSVLETQIIGRSLMKAYTFALAQARQNYGPEVFLILYYFYYQYF